MNRLLERQKPLPGSVDTCSDVPSDPATSPSSDVAHRSVSPFRWPGGKFYARRLILRELPSHWDYCEPFAGGASVFFAKPAARGMVVLNDADAELVNAYVQIRDNVERLIAMLDKAAVTKHGHAYYKNDYEPAGGLERAFRWYYLNRTSYSGIMRPENCYWSYERRWSAPPERWGPRLRAASVKLQGVVLSCGDFEKTIDGLPDGCFVFADPPYYASDQQRLYNAVFEPEDHERLAGCLRRNSDRLLFLLTYDDHPHVRELYQWVSSVKARRWNYYIGRTDDQRHGPAKRDGFRGGRDKGSELFIRNYAVFAGDTPPLF